MLTIGDRFPAFKLKAAVSLEKGKEFQVVSNEDHPGKWKVVFFWPKDFTFICPTEIAAFGKHNRDFEERDARVLGASTDNEYVHLAWRKSHPDLKDQVIAAKNFTPAGRPRCAAINDQDSATMRSVVRRRPPGAAFR